MRFEVAVHDAFFLEEFNQVDELCKEDSYDIFSHFLLAIGYEVIDCPIRDVFKYVVFYCLLSFLDSHQVDNMWNPIPDRLQNNFFIDNL